jgi:CRP-like cAMP-binding protein
LVPQVPISLGGEGNVFASASFNARMPALNGDRLSEDIHNLLLRALPAESLARLKASSQLVPLSQGQAIDHVNGPVRHIYMVNRGYISIIKRMQDGRSVEVGGVGIEGITAPTTALGQHELAVLDTVVQIPGTAFRIERRALHRELERDPALRQAVTGYVRYLLSQIAQTAACNRLHSTRRRCSRWLLVAHDNALADSFPLTHEFLAMMLGGQRAGVSMAAHWLKQAGLITYVRSDITILDRHGLEQSACECYGASREELGHLYPVRNGENHGG